MVCRAVNLQIVLINLSSEIALKKVTAGQIFESGAEMSHSW